MLPVWVLRYVVGMPIYGADRKLSLTSTVLFRTGAAISPQRNGERVHEGIVIISRGVSSIPVEEVRSRGSSGKPRLTVVEDEEGLLGLDVD